MKLLVSAFLLLALSYPATAEVVLLFRGTCGNFFFRGQPPIGPSGCQYMKICQKRTPAGGYEYATLYDTSRRIPVYSAYEFVGYARYTRNTPWYIEPQLDGHNGRPFMAPESTVNRYLRGRHQALNNDYYQSGYDKGHLVPVKHRDSQPCVDATFTLTNAAPQHYSFNRGQWRVKEAQVAIILTTRCLNRGFHAYIVTGVMPGNIIINGRVNVPSYFWTTYCCADRYNRPQFSGAYYGVNDHTNIVTPISVADLDAWLRTAYAYKGFQVFSNACQ